MSGAQDSAAAPAAMSPLRFRLLSLAVLAALAVLCSLGSWQVQRLVWKEALIARVEARLKAAPVALPARADWASLQPEDIEYRRVTLSGRFDHGQEVHVFITLGSPKGPKGGQGYFVLTPLTLADGAVVFVNRGFVPLDAKDPAQRSAGQVAGEVAITGLMRPAEPSSWLSPEPDLEKNVWFVRDPAAMARARGLDPAIVAPFTVDADATPVPGGLPQGGETIVGFSNNHLGYAITWFGLAAALVGIWLRLLVLQRKARRG